MSFIHDTRSVEQQRFFSGQRLFDTDLQGIEAFNREMRWLHNQSLHQPGIGNGFAVTGKKGDRTVRIDPGYAIDDQGREIVLTSSRTVPVPPVAGEGGKPTRFLLTVAYPDDIDLEIVERRAGLCGDEGATRLRVEPILCWVLLNEAGAPENAEQAAAIQIGHQLVLAEISVRDCKLDKDLTITQRRNARPTQQPYIACGGERPEWRVLGEGESVFEGDGDEERCFRAIGIIGAEIDTTSGGFLTEPRYFARLSGPRFFEVPDSLVNGGPSFSLLDGLVQIDKPGPSRFRVRVMVLMLNNAQWPERLFIEESAPEFEGGGEVLVASTGTAMVENGILTAANPLSDWSIVWMGVEG